MLGSWCCEDAVQIRSCAYIPGVFTRIFLSNMTKESIADVEILFLRTRCIKVGVSQAPAWSQEFQAVPGMRWHHQCLCFQLSTSLK